MRHDAQHTVERPVTVEGIGVHTGKPVTLTIRPAGAGVGIKFIRSDLKPGISIPARYDAVCATDLCTVIGDGSGASISTVEHLLSALAAFGVDNAIVEVDGPETPIMDGSSSSFVDAIEEAGLLELPARRRYIKVLRKVRIENGSSFAELSPNTKGLKLDVEVDFECSVIGRQRTRFDLTREAYRRELSRARTFGFLKDVERLWKAGMALGASLDNTIAIGDERVLNTEGLRFRDEFSRHKALDAIGDLALAGLPIIGSFRSYRGGHRLNIGVIEALFADKSAYRIVDGAVPATTSRRGDFVPAGIPAAAFAPDMS
ncbi:MAG: UDP-3-O-acyl-N-acetylglucosamine deacetylase [Hyphomicrobiales bacterium]|nr:UDP-3-O-acyl-N-acetylglucosamine deacetylase [Hyphomicrobiales bacterium]MBV8768173.1 UDP-3-O-acyl-N-acetylglucosamine deacetylase [Hyphomicrobiales bacterium]MBV9589058.1 UDP-3-O-acyl-N-acetylglucosamine deacetylase [Hyphomicrobiales bacterium]MBV9751641.1 UDP-3-O-acyl-N-acetylglucosamine deacetylase [Hyphomicrobiales bacterium]MBV9974032.1 UDP-3-O-acyl-N-acetylglucosamine deacetylase [Hyphomicrobiales bacterium]